MPARPSPKKKVQHHSDDDDAAVVRNPLKRLRPPSSSPELDPEASDSPGSLRDFVLDDEAEEAEEGEDELEDNDDEGGDAQDDDDAVSVTPPSRKRNPPKYPTDSDDEGVAVSSNYEADVVSSPKKKSTATPQKAARGKKIDVVSDVEVDDGPTEKPPKPNVKEMLRRQIDRASASKKRRVDDSQSDGSEVEMVAPKPSQSKRKRVVEVEVVDDSEVEIVEAPKSSAKSKAARALAASPVKKEKASTAGSPAKKKRNTTASKQVKIVDDSDDTYGVKAGLAPGDSMYSGGRKPKVHHDNLNGNGGTPPMTTRARSGVKTSGPASVSQTIVGPSTASPDWEEWDDDDPPVVDLPPSPTTTALDLKSTKKTAVTLKNVAARDPLNKVSPSKPPAKVPASETPKKPALSESPKKALVAISPKKTSNSDSSSNPPVSNPPNDKEDLSVSPVKVEAAPPTAFDFSKRTQTPPPVVASGSGTVHVQTPFKFGQEDDETSPFIVAQTTGPNLFTSKAWTALPRPVSCEVSQPRYIDPYLDQRGGYNNRCNLRMCTLLSASSTQYTGKVAKLPAFSSWLQVLRANFEALAGAFNFVQDGRFLNPSTASPLSVVARKLNDTRFDLYVRNQTAVCFSPAIVGESWLHTLQPPAGTSQWTSRALKVRMHLGDYQRFAGFLGEVARRGVLHTGVWNRLLNFNSKLIRRDDAEHILEGSGPAAMPDGFLIDDEETEREDAPRVANQRFLSQTIQGIDFSDEIPVYDARNLPDGFQWSADVFTHLDRHFRMVDMAEFPASDPELPVNSLVGLGYTVQYYRSLGPASQGTPRRNGKGRVEPEPAELTVNLFLQFVLLFGVPPF